MPSRDRRRRSIERASNCDEAGQEFGTMTSVPGPGSTAERKFHLVLIKPTHYDDEGYPIQWFRSAIPSNTLACMNGLAEDAARRQVLGPDVDIRLHTFDETNTRVRPARIVRMIEKAGGRGLIC